MEKKDSSKYWTFYANYSHFIEQQLKWLLFKC